MPSTWKANATPTRPAIKSPEKSSGNITFDNGNGSESLLKKNVSFSEKKKKSVYQYPAEIEEAPARRQWGAPSAVIQPPKDSYADFADWEFGNVDDDRELEIDSSK